VDSWDLAATEARMRKGLRVAVVLFVLGLADPLTAITDLGLVTTSSGVELHEV
jgi:hypothetical protein